MSAPTVKFGLLCEEYSVTSFIQVSNPRMQAIARLIKGEKSNEVIFEVAKYVAKNINYALNITGQPTTFRHTKVFRFYGPIYLVDTGELNYGWLLPNQTDQTHYGICFDTAVYTCTLLRLKGLPAYTILGAVLENKNRKLVGFHAWVETIGNEEKALVIETTSPRPAIFQADNIYRGKMPYVYDPICRFNESDWWEDKVKAKKYVELALDAIQKPQSTD